MIYFDDAATMPMLPVVRERLRELLDLELGNAAALHTPGQNAKNIIETARVDIARLVNAEPEEIIFTSGGSESNNTVMNTFAGKNIVVSSIEHPSVLEAAKSRAGNLKLLPVDQQGKVILDNVPHDADLISVMLANNELGIIQPVPEIVQQVHTHKITRAFVHTDATQALGKIPIDVKGLGVDYLTASAHKIGGPLGVGILYIRKGVPLVPLILGGHQENKRRAGTSNTLAIAGFGAAAKWTQDHQVWRKYEKIGQLRNELCERILAEIPYSSVNGYRVFVSTNPEKGELNTLPHILNMSFQAAEGESIQLYLDVAGIAVSTGSACAAGDIQPSHVLMATHHDAEVAHSSVRFSLGLNTNETDIDVVMKVLPDIIKRLQDMSTVKVGAKNE